MSALWLVAWLLAGLPPAFVGPSWNTWGLALAASAAIDLGVAEVLTYRRLIRPEVERVWRPGIGWTYASQEASKED